MNDFNSFNGGYYNPITLNVPTNNVYNLFCEIINISDSFVVSALLLFISKYCRVSDQEFVKCFDIT